MARSKRDEMKRSIAQASNHLAAAILDINNVYDQFKEATEKFKADSKDTSSEMSQGESVSHADYAEYLKSVMFGISNTRDAALSFAKAAWNIEEDALISYM